MGVNETYETITVDVYNCARCGKDHSKLIFIALKGEPVMDNRKIPYQYWCLCPALREPILLHKGVDDDNRRNE